MSWVPRGLSLLAKNYDGFAMTQIIQSLTRELDRLQREIDALKKQVGGAQ